MFAFALWDAETRSFHLVRDRIGIKPLYYGFSNRTFLFGSELKSIMAHPAFVAEVDREALALFFRHQYIPHPYSIYRGIKKLAPGCYLTLNVEHPSDEPKVRAYWSAKEVAEDGARNPFDGNDQDAVAELEYLLKEAIGLRMIADVPLGAFLSGGIDSSAVVALMQGQSTRPVKTFTIGFSDDRYDEAIHAKRVAQHLRTDHTELYLTGDQTLQVIPRISHLYDEPFADSSQVPTLLLSELARQHVTVILSGDGGDELFGGYTRYFLAQALWRRLRCLPQSVRHASARAIRGIPLESWSTIFDQLRRILPTHVGNTLRGDRAHKFADVLSAKHPEDFYRLMMSCWKNPAELVVATREPATVFTDPYQWANLPSFYQRMMFLDIGSYLPEDILAKIDRASMGVSLEARVPLLDHRLVEFAARIPLRFKIRRGQGKWLLRQVLYRYVPRELVERKKMGFGIPLGAWLRGPLRDWAEDLLDEKRMFQDGFLQPALVQKTWTDHLSGIRDWAPYIWTVLMFQAWRCQWLKKPISDNLPMSQAVL